MARRLGESPYLCRIFFIIAGFFLFYTINTAMDTWDFAKKRFFRLAPNIWLFIVLTMISALFIKNIHCSLEGNILRIFLLHNIGLSPITGGTGMNASWFVSCLFWVSLFYFYISKIFEKKHLNLIIWILTTCCFAGVLHVKGYNVAFHSGNKLLFFNIGVLRALASMGLGYFICMFYKKGILQNVSKLGCFFLTALECSCLGFLGYYLLYCPKLPGKSSFVEVFVFVILFYLFLIKKGFISKLLDNNLSVTLGNYSYAIYCFHPLFLSLFRELIGKGAFINIFQTYKVAFFFVDVILAVVAGIILYYIFEKPVANFVSKKLKNKNDP